MSSEVYVDELREGLLAKNTRTNETVSLIGTLTLDNGVELWIVDGDNGVYMEYERYLNNPFYWGE